MWSGRSLVVLKGLTYAPTGGIVAAPTTSLPEQLGGVRNWDYRYCWLRDTTFTLLALMNAGYYDEARRWRDWLFRAVAGSPDQLQIMYGLGGERRLTEWEIPWLPGYEGSRPVRIGNAAVNQIQLDVYGEILDALYHAHSHGLPPNKHGDAVGTVLLKHLAKTWDQPDEGIWEVRGPRQHFTHSKVMAWVAFDRVVKVLDQRGNTGTATQRWRHVRDRIHADVCRKRSILHSVALFRPTGRRRSMRASCSCRSSAFCPQPTRASSAPSRRSSGASLSTGLSIATTPER